MRVLLPLFVLASSLGTAGTITSGSATYTTGALPNSQTSTNPTSDFRPLGGTTTDHLFSNWWYYRVAGDTRDRPIGTYTKSGGGTISTSEVSAGNTSTFTIAERNAAANLRFTGVLAYVLTSGPGNTYALLEMAFSITNPTAAPLTISLFNYVDLDLQNSPGNDSATLFLPRAIRISDPGGMTFYHSAPAAAAYQVTAYSTLSASLLNATATNLNNTGLPFGSGDYTGAWQWNIVVAPGQTGVVRSFVGTTLPAEIPEPSSLALVSLGVTLAAMLRLHR